VAVLAAIRAAKTATLATNALDTLRWLILLPEV
jgi:hypothetical protein